MSQVGEQHQRLMRKLDLMRQRMVILDRLIEEIRDSDAAQGCLRDIAADLHEAQVLAIRIDSGEFDP